VQQKIHILSSFQSSRETSMIKAWWQTFFGT
jgi:hypothetical protein